MLRCPKCGSGDVRRTQRSSFVAQLLRNIGRVPHLCRSCHHCFYRRKQAEDPTTGINE